MNSLCDDIGPEALKLNIDDTGRSQRDGPFARVETGIGRQVEPTGEIVTLGRVNGQRHGFAIVVGRFVGDSLDTGPFPRHDGNGENRTERLEAGRDAQIGPNLERRCSCIRVFKPGRPACQAAEREAELTIAKAEVQAEKIIEGARAELNGLKREMEMLGLEKNAFLVKMRSLVASQWKLLQEEKISEPVAPEKEETMQPEEEPVVRCWETSSPKGIFPRNWARF